MEGKCADSERLKRPITQLRYRYFIRIRIRQNKLKKFWRELQKIEH